MDIRFLESLICVVKAGSIAGAARTQGLTATAVSQRIRTLEAQLGHKLLSRNGHKASPTQACLNLLPRARHLIEQTLALPSDIEPNGYSGTLRLGAISTALTDFIPAIVKTFTRSAPNVELNIIPGTSATLYDQLLTKEIDAALIVKPYFTCSKSLQTAYIIDQPLVLVESSDSAGHKNEKSAAQIVHTTPLIVYDRRSWGGKKAWQWIEAQNACPNIVCELDGLETIALLVEQGLGAAILPLWHGLANNNKLEKTSISHAVQYERSIVLASNQTYPFQNLIDLCTKSIL